MKMFRMLLYRFRDFRPRGSWMTSNHTCFEKFTQGDLFWPITSFYFMVFEIWHDWPFAGFLTSSDLKSPSSIVESAFWLLTSWYFPDNLALLGLNKDIWKFTKIRHGTWFWIELDFECNNPKHTRMERFKNKKNISLSIFIIYQTTFPNSEICLI